MCAEPMKNEETIYHEAVSKPPEERKAYLEAACGGDAGLLARIEALLKAREVKDSFLEAPSIDRNATLDASPSIEGPGTKIGRYELLELIGEGGMGLVYLAEQKKPVKRRVALKIIKPGMDSKQVIARFEAERQALAVLDHPNIAHVFDAGTTKEGRPYFIMEYVKGMSITRYCDENKLNIERRLRLFEQVCEGIHHAHQKGIIHRDLKPTNILVSVHGDRAVPKIIDFGIAKAVTQPLTEKTFVTFQGQLLGTPQYMSPEQVDMATQDIDTRSDIYSLGVVLYELLAGVLPFERESFASLGFAEVQRTIREQEPASPSTRLTRLGEKAKIIAASRDTHVIALARRLHRELEWVPLKAMRKDRCRRYRSASELADDIRHYLNGLPLIAGPETAVYRMQKFVGKHAGSVVTAALVAVAIVLGLIIHEISGLLAGSYVDHAQALCEQGEVGRGMLWLADSLKIAPEGSNDLGRAIRTSLAAWHGQLHSLRAVVKYPDEINSVTFSPDGSRILAACMDGTARLCDSTTGKLIGKPLQHGSKVQTVAVSADGTRIASGGEDGSVKLWDAVTLESVGESMQHEKGLVIAFSPDSSRLITGGTDGAVQFWNAGTGNPLGKATQMVPELGDFWIDGVRLYEGEYIARDSNTPSLINTAVNMLSNGGFEAGTTEPWSTYGNIATEVVRGLAGATIPEAVIEGDSCLHVVVSKPGANYWDIGLRHRGHIFEAGKKYTLSLFLKSKKGKLKINIKPGMAAAPWTGFGNRIVTITEKWAEFSITTPVLTEDISPAGITLNYVTERNGDVRAVACCPNGLQVVLAAGGGRFPPRIHQVFDVDRGEPIGPRLNTTRPAHSMAISADGTRLATGDGAGLIRVWEVATGEPAFEPIVHGGAVSALAFSPDGSRIVSGGNTRMALLWDAA
ncbi:MAG: protein kinase domain-containing protein, partial [Planctomycetota bacterium]